MSTATNWVVGVLILLVLVYLVLVFGGIRSLADHWIENENYSGATVGLEALDYLPMSDQVRLELEMDLAFCYSLAGDYQNAVSWYSRVLELDSNSIHALYHKARNLERMSRCKEAISEINKAILMRSGVVVVFYDDPDNQVSTRLLYELRYRMHDCLGMTELAREDSIAVVNIKDVNVE